MLTAEVVRPTWGNGIPLGVMPTRQVHEAARAAAAASPAPAAGSGNLTYHGGPVVQNAKVVGVSWGAIDATLTANLPLFYADIVNSPYMDWLSEYNTVGRPAPTTNQGIARGLTYGGTVVITPSAGGATVTDAQIQSELIAQVNAGTLPKPTLGCDGFTGVEAP